MLPSVYMLHDTVADLYYLGTYGDWGPIHKAKIYNNVKTPQRLLANAIKESTETLQYAQLHYDQFPTEKHYLKLEKLKQRESKADWGFRIVEFELVPVKT